MRLLPPLLIGVLLAGPALSQRAPDELPRLQAEYRDELIRARRLRADAAQAQAEIAGLDQRLAALSNAASTEDAVITAQRARLAQLSEREAAITADLSRARGVQGRLLSALQMMSRKPPPPLLTPSDKAVDTVRAAILMKAMTPELERRAGALVERQTELQRVRRLAALSSEALFTAESAQGDRRAEIESLAVRKRNLERVLRVEAAEAERAAAALEARIRSLGGAAPELTDEAPAMATALPAGRDRLSPPVEGVPSERFGGRSNGWRWRADRLPVAAPAPGRVAFSGPLKGYGQVIILDLGPGWRVVVAGLEDLRVVTGQRVTEGQALGVTAPDGEAYLELRRDERPIDPAPWLR